MVLFKRLSKPLLAFFVRLRYPYSLPEELASDLGLPLCNSMPFARIETKICKRRWCPSTLYKFMSRDEALSTLSRAYRVDHFGCKEIVSYYFREGWIEFELHFDPEGRLRRLQLHAPKQLSLEPIEIPLAVR